jgi:hypothetical protein
MSLELVSQSVVTFSWLLSSVCLRYAAAKPSVWLRTRVRKVRRSNNFGTDYPLYCGWLLPRYFSVDQISWTHWFSVQWLRTVLCSIVVRTSAASLVSTQHGFADAIQAHLGCRATHGAHV